MGDSWKFGKIQKVFSSGSILVLNIRLPGKTIYLGIGRGGEYCGIWNLKNNVPSKLRIVKDRFLEFVRSNINGNSIVNVKIDNDDRIVKIELFDGSILLLFWKGRSFYFSFGKKEVDAFKVYQPWKSMKMEILNTFDFDVFDEIGRRKIEGISDESFVGENPIDLFVDTNEAQRIDNKKAKRKVENIKNDLDRCMRWREIQSLVEREDLDLTPREFSHKDFKVKFETSDNFYQRRDKIYIKIKKLKTGEKILRQRLDEAQNSLDNKKIEIVDQKIFTPVWNMAKELKVADKTSTSNIEVFQIKDHKYAKGKNAEGNDQLRTKWANKNDVWVHLDGHSSAHVIIKGPNSSSIECISIAGSIVAQASGLDVDQIPILYTQVKDLKGVKGSPGKVIYKKEKHLKIVKVNWKEIISSTWFE